MNEVELRGGIQKLDSGVLIGLCKDIYQYQETGVIKHYSILNALSTGSNVREFESSIIEEAHKRFGEIVLLLLKGCPQRYLK